MSSKSQAPLQQPESSCSSTSPRCRSKIAPQGRYSLGRGNGSPERTKRFHRMSIQHCRRYATSHVPSNGSCVIRAAVAKLLEQAGLSHRTLDAATRSFYCFEPCADYAAKRPLEAILRAGQHAPARSEGSRGRYLRERRAHDCDARPRAFTRWRARYGHSGATRCRQHSTVFVGNAIRLVLGTQCAAHKHLCCPR